MVCVMEGLSTASSVGLKVQESVRAGKSLLCILLERKGDLKQKAVYYSLPNTYEEIREAKRRKEMS